MKSKTSKRKNKMKKCCTKDCKKKQVAWIETKGYCIDCAEEVSYRKKVERWAEKREMEKLKA